MNHVFLSYRHESDDHARNVRRLGERLRDRDIPVALDQFYLEENPGGPDGGWRKWCEDHAEQSACVLIACSKGWFDCYRKEGESVVGLGAALEADVFAQEIYDEKGYNARVRLVILDDFNAAEIPPRLRAWHIFRPFAEDDEFDQTAKWIRKRLAMPLTQGRAQKTVFLAECVFDMQKERRKLKSFLEEKNWKVLPLSTYQNANRQLALEADLRECVAFVQLLESYPRDTGFDKAQWVSAQNLGKPCFHFRDGRIVPDEADAPHREFLTRKDVILGSFEDFKTHVGDELEELWQRQKSVPLGPPGLRHALVRVVIRSPNRDHLWDTVFDWIDREPDIRSQLLEETEAFPDKADPAVPCHGYLIVCDSAAAGPGPYSPGRDMDHCAVVQLQKIKLKDESRLPPAGIVYWPPPAPSWPRLLRVAPPKLYRILGDAPTELPTFFNDVRRAAQ